MIFDRLRMGDLVSWNKEAIIRELDHMTNGSMWRHEELDCFLQVTKLKNDALGPMCELQCVNDCGLHMFHTMNREEYEEYFEEIGTDIFVFASSLYDVGMVFAAHNGEVENEDTYDFSNDSADILEQIIRGTLPDFKRKNN